MQVVERIALAAFGLIVLYLLFNSQNASSVISSIGSNAGGLFGTLQGRSVSYGAGSGLGTGVTVSGGPLG
jgi:hypothetical protein